jgi:hypothetical protein
LTSPILADQLMRPVDQRIAAACTKLGATYTRFVDDLAISAPFDLSTSGVPNLVYDILRQNGFIPHPDKNFFGPIDRKAAVTNIRFHRGHFDVRKEYVEEIFRQLDDAYNLACGRGFEGPYVTESQLWGRVQFICWVNPHRKRSLLTGFAKVNWRKAGEQARQRGLVASSKRPAGSKHAINGASPLERDIDGATALW